MTNERVAELLQRELFSLPLVHFTQKQKPI